MISNSMSKSKRISLGLRVLFRAMRPRKDDLSLPEIHHTSAGDEYHIYYPRGKALRTVMLIYGMSIEGELDGRLQKFARSCTGAGLKVIVPHLPGLMDFIVAPGDMARLERMTAELEVENRVKMALVGFSTGGSYSLLLAGNPSLKDKIGPVVLFSPIYDARNVAERLHAPADPAPQTPKEWDQFIWAQFVIAYRNRNHLNLPNELQEALQIFLIDYYRYEVEVKRVFYNNYILPLGLVGHDNLLNEGAALDDLSARGKISRVESPVFIMHDSADRVVPPEHSRSMYAELALRGSAFRQGVLITPWLSHVEMQKTGSPRELVQFISFMSELFSDIPGTEQ